MHDKVDNFTHTIAAFVISEEIQKKVTGCQLPYSCVLLQTAGDMNIEVKIFCGASLYWLPDGMQSPSRFGGQLLD